MFQRPLERDCQSSIRVHRRSYQRGDATHSSDPRAGDAADVGTARVSLLAEAIVCLGLCLMIAAACGGSSASLPSGSASAPSATQTPQCTSSQLYGALVSKQGTGPDTVLRFGIGNTLNTCAIAGPPEIRWYDHTGKLLTDNVGLPPATNVTCQPGATNFTTCVDSVAVILPGGAPLPAANVEGSAIVVVAVAESAACVEPGVTPAHFIGLAFPGTMLDVQIELPSDVELTRCSSQVTLQGYGPSS